jgi:prefoldin subunit 5
MDDKQLDELYKEIRRLYRKKFKLTEKIESLSKQITTIENARAGKEYLVTWEDGSID